MSKTLNGAFPRLLHCYLGLCAYHSPDILVVIEPLTGWALDDILVMGVSMELGGSPVDQEGLFTSQMVIVFREKSA